MNKTYLCLGSVQIYRFYVSLSHFHLFIITFALGIFSPTPCACQYLAFFLITRRPRQLVPRYQSLVFRRGVVSQP